MSDGKQRAANKTKSLKRTHEETAERALAVAGDAVAAARKAAKKSRKKLQKKAAKLTRETRRVSRKLAKAQHKVSNAEAALAAVGTPSSGESSKKAAVPGAPGNDRGSGATSLERGNAVELTPPLPQPEPAPATLAELRREAKDKKIPGYYRLAKADLVAALQANGAASGT